MVHTKVYTFVGYDLDTLLRHVRVIDALKAKATRIPFKGMIGV